MRVNGKYTDVPDQPAFDFVEGMREMAEAVRRMARVYHRMEDYGILASEIPFRNKMPNALDRFADAAVEVVESFEDAVAPMERDTGRKSRAPAEMMAEIEKFRLAVRDLSRCNPNFGFQYRPTKASRKKSAKSAA